MRVSNNEIINSTVADLVVSEAFPLIHAIGCSFEAIFDQVLDPGINALFEDQEIIYTAVTPGADGNDIFIHIDPDVGANHPLDIIVVGTDIQIILATNAGDPAFVEFQDLTYTAVIPGDGGNAIFISYTKPDALEALVVTVIDQEIDVQLETDVLGDSISTALEVKTAIEASMEASALVTVEVTGSSSAIQVKGDASLEHGGENAQYITTNEELCSAITLNMEANVLITATTSDPDNILIPGAAFNLEGGADPTGSTTGVLQFQTSINQTPPLYFTDADAPIMINTGLVELTVIARNYANLMAQYGRFIWTPDVLNEGTGPLQIRYNTKGV